jgi:hypothetical protein
MGDRYERTSRATPGFTARPSRRRRRFEPARASNWRRASVLPPRLSNALTRASFDSRSLISTTRAAPRPRTRTEARATRAVSGCALVPAGAGGADGAFDPPDPPELGVVAVVVVMGSVGTVTVGSGTEGSVVVTQPTPGAHTCCGAGGTAPVKVPAASSPPVKIAAPSTARLVESSFLWFGEGEGPMDSSQTVVNKTESFRRKDPRTG